MVVVGAVSAGAAEIAGTAASVDAASVAEVAAAAMVLVAAALCFTCAQFQPSLMLTTPPADIS